MTINRLAHEYELRGYLYSAWALRPHKFMRDWDQTLLVIEHSRGVPLSRLIGSPMEIEQFLRIAANLSLAIGRLNGEDLIHKGTKPSSLLVKERSVWAQASVKVIATNLGCIHTNSFQA